MAEKELVNSDHHKYICYNTVTLNFVPTYGRIYPFSKRQILDLSKLKEFAYDNFYFDENCRKFSRQEENTERKGEIACNEQFLLFPQCFQRTYTADT